MKFALNILLVFMASTVVAQSTIRFQPQITTEARSLGDVLVISNDSLHLARIPLDSPLKPGSIINKKQIIDWLQRKNSSIAYKWLGKKTAKVLDTSQTEGKQLLVKAQDALTTVLNKQQYTRLKISTKTIVASTKLPLSAFKPVIKEQYPPARRMCARLKYQNKSIAIWFSVKAYQKVLVANHRLKMNTLVDAKDFILQERNIAGLKGMPFTTLPHSIWLKQSLNEGQILHEQQIGTIPEIRKGQAATIRISKRGILVSMNAVALEHGYIGQVIKMSNPQNNKSIKARIIAAREAEIIP